MLKDLLRPRRYLPALFCVGLAIFYLYEYLLRVLPSVTTQGVTQAYHLMPASFGNLCSAYYLIYVPLQLIAGILVDRVRLFYLMALAFLSCALGCYLFANGVDYWVAVLGRGFMGAGAAFTFITVLKAVSARLSSRYFTFYLGIIICVGMLGGMLMDFALVFVMKHLGWRLCCYFLALLGLLAALLSRYGFRGIALSVKNASAKQPILVDLKVMVGLFVNKRLWVLCLIGALLYLPIAGLAESWGVRFLHHANQFSQLMASVEIGMLFLGFAVGAPILGWIHDQYNEYQLILTAGAVGTTVLLSIVLFVPDMTGFKTGVGLFLLGLFSSSMVVVLSLCRQYSEKHNFGKVFGMANFVMMLAGGSSWLIGLLIEWVAQNHLNDYLPLYAVSSYQLAFLVLPCGSMLAVFLTFFVRDKMS